MEGVNLNNYYTCSFLEDSYRDGVDAIIREYGGRISSGAICDDIE